MCFIIRTTRLILGLRKGQQKPSAHSSGDTWTLARQIHFACNAVYIRLLTREPPGRIKSNLILTLARELYRGKRNDVVVPSSWGTTSRAASLRICEGWIPAHGLGRPSVELLHHRDLPGSLQNAVMPCSSNPGYSTRRGSR